MRLEPVSVLAPRPRIPTRRALLLAGVAGAAGIGMGMGFGWWRWGKGEQAGEAARPMDPRLAHALELASPTTPIQALLSEQMFLLAVVHETEQAGNRHPELWTAVQRIAAEIVRDRSLPDRRIRARSILDLLERGRPSGTGLELLVQDLRRALR